MDDELPESRIRLSRDSMILAKLNTGKGLGKGLGVAQVLEVLEVRPLPIVSILAFTSLAGQPLGETHLVLHRSCLQSHLRGQILTVA